MSFRSGAEPIRAEPAGPPPGAPSLARRLARYQAERFPLAGFVPLIAVFTFSSAAYSRLARGVGGFVDLGLLLVGIATAVVCFFVLRVLDEHKDADVDRRYRPELPVPRGLVTLAELRVVAATAMAVVILLNAWVAPVLLMPLAAAAVWATLMTKEFFAPRWLRAHPAAYLVTHMAIMPLIDAYTTGLDWLVAGVRAPRGLGLFLAVTFANGVLVEVGRKIRAPGDEREGVDTYTCAWGLRAAPAVWLVTLAASGLLAVRAARHGGTPIVTAAIVMVLGIAALVPAVSFLRAATAARARRIEQASQWWPAVTYLLLGAVPFVSRLMGIR